jgi:hypothetical protein
VSSASFSARPKIVAGERNPAPRSFVRSFVPWLRSFLLSAQGVYRRQLYKAPLGARTKAVKVSPALGRKSVLFPIYIIIACQDATVALTHRYGIRRRCVKFVACKLKASDDIRLFLF